MRTSSVVASSPVCAGRGEAVRQHRPLTPARFLHRTGPYVSDAGGSDGHGRTTAVDVSRPDGLSRTRRTWE
jgi:hypothetical protein